VDYPKNKTQACRWCGQPVRWVRAEPGRMFNGHMIYTYTEPNPHDCPQRDAIAKGLLPASEAMRHTLRQQKEE